MSLEEFKEKCLYYYKQALRDYGVAPTLIEENMEKQFMDEYEEQILKDYVENK